MLLKCIFASILKWVTHMVRGNQPGQQVQGKTGKVTRHGIGVSPDSKEQ